MATIFAKGRPSPMAAPGNTASKWVSRKLLTFSSTRRLFHRLKIGYRYTLPWILPKTQNFLQFEIALKVWIRADTFTFLKTIGSANATISYHLNLLHFQSSNQTQQCMHKFFHQGLSIMKKMLNQIGKRKQFARIPQINVRLLMY